MAGSAKGTPARNSMLGDFLREMAVLYAVFIPLERIMIQQAPLTIAWLVTILGLSGGLLVGGLLLEVRRK